MFCHLEKASSYQFNFILSVTAPNAEKNGGFQSSLTFFSEDQQYILQGLHLHIIKLSDHGWLATICVHVHSLQHQVHNSWLLSFHGLPTLLSRSFFIIVWIPRLYLPIFLSTKKADFLSTIVRISYTRAGFISVWYCSCSCLATLAAHFFSTKTHNNWLLSLF